MISWDRCGDSTYVGVMTRYEIEVLRSYTDGLVSLLDHHLALFDTTPDGCSWPHPELGRDARVTAILRAEIGEQEPDWVHSVSAAACLRDVSSHARLMACALSSSSGVVHLASRAEAEAWLRCIRLVLVTITAMADERGEVSGKACEPTVSWLTEVSDGLSAVLDDTTSPTMTADR
ncbi:hypothetical protein [Nocardia sp. NRRL S-836]|uniref:DUF2017 family protein n=1 Tax=Nocardia sp. NRRL S-836 TaxID=1519492 RepID=UPI0006AE0BE7|nr:hypothetical protein [Nocardia sp. NRRL S-836]KOV83941.1 hypothetical protein ADL03_18940 [Nocardia sp. NRRL S-836]